jgi:tRNA(Ile2)-agmatinylcytidine synthase
LRCIVGLDDTDSRLGHCTTYLGYRLAAELLRQGCTFSRYPRLVRLNPNIPFKTRGNAAVCLDFETERPDDAFRTADSLLRQLSDVENGANSGVVFVRGDPDEEFFRVLYEKTVSRMVSHKRVAKLLADRGIERVTLGNGMGLVGAAASIGFTEEQDHTYEIIAYRIPENCGSPRVVDEESVRQSEREMFPHVFNSYDYGSRRMLVAPHGPDPVFIGMRADSPAAALKAFTMAAYSEVLEGHMIYLSNQCTDAHLKDRLAFPLSAYSSGWLDGTVESIESGPGGHLYISLSVRNSSVPCAVYSQAGDLRKMARRLATGDRLRVSGGVRRGSGRHPPILNVEKIQVISVAARLELENPTCEKCGRRMKSEGKEKGFQCRSCGLTTGDREKVAVEAPRDIHPGIHLPSPGAQRHLTKQLVRYGHELCSAQPLIDRWIDPDPVRPLRVPARSPR